MSLVSRMTTEMFAKCLQSILALALFMVGDETLGNSSSYPVIELRSQFVEADHVIYAAVAEKKSLESIENGPARSCGVNYRVKILEEFKGSLNAEFVWFSTDRFLLPQHELKRGDHALILLRDLSNTVDPRSARTRENLAIASIATTESCRRARSNLYLSDLAENAFLIGFAEENARSASKGWLEFSPSRTAVAYEHDRPKRAANGFTRVKWSSVRRSLMIW
jgi:hypothetical protein